MNERKGKEDISGKDECVGSGSILALPISLTIQLLDIEDNQKPLKT